MLKPHVDRFTNDAEILTYQVQPFEAGRSLYQLLRGKLRVSRSLLRKIRGEYRVRFNGGYVDFDTIVQAGDLVELNFSFTEEADFAPEAMELAIIFEDANLLVLNKPAGILVHPTSDERSGTLANGVLAYLQRQGNFNLFRAIHRLDRNTSGLLLIAKNQYAHNYMTDQFESQQIHREYLALVHGVLANDVGVIDAPIGRAAGSIIERRIDPEAGKAAVTHYRVVERYPDATLVALRLETGRTHQIRIHLHHLGHPLFGDTLYGGQDNLIGRHALHSWRICCQLPLTHDEQEFVAPLARDLRELIARVKGEE